ncbi:MAG: Fe-S cluster assembly protein SufD [Paludibacteraceae bacterium]|nr:Fe-S cluster assembly protein SufD [Paludibacteraceae bacterium]
MTSFQELYEQVKDNIETYSANSLNRHRAAFADILKQNGMPTRHTENYRNIDFSEALDIDYGVNVRHLQLPASSQPAMCNVHGMHSVVCWVVNNHVQLPDEISSLGITVCSIKEAEKKYPELIEKYLNVLCLRQNDSLLSLNEMFAQDGLFVYIPDNIELQRPLQIMNVLNADLDLMTSAHNLVVIGQNAKAQILVCEHAAQNRHYFTTSTTEVFVGKNAKYEHYNLEDTSSQMCKINNVIIQQEEYSEVLSNVITLRNGQTRNNILIDQVGTHCQTELCGMFIGSGEQVLDNFTQISHYSTNGKSNELFKYVLDDKSKGVFKGLLKVAPNAQKTEAYQTNRNILLTNDAKVRTEPQLEIYADDVKCSHGATTGQLDEKALFYMQQRGISEAEAKLLLMNAFVADVINNIRIEALQDRIRTLTDNRLRNNEDTTCQICQNR